MVRWTAQYPNKTAAEFAESRFAPANFSSSIVASLNAKVVVQDAGNVSSAATGPATLDLDCTGSWSVCTAACEAKGARQWHTSVAQSGSGAACPNATTDCVRGEGGCVANIDCTGAWTACTVACEAKEARSWIQATAPSGTGAACPNATTDCTPGQDACAAALAPTLPPTPPPQRPGSGKEYGRGALQFDASVQECKEGQLCTLQIQRVNGSFGYIEARLLSLSVTRCPSITHCASPVSRSGLQSTWFPTSAL